MSLKDIERMWADLPEAERWVATEFVTRIWKGLAVYGPITENKKNWAKECFEEQLDSACYNLIALWELARVGKPGQ